MVWRKGQAYSQDLRDRVLSTEGPSRAVAARFGVSVSYVVKARQRYLRDGDASARPQRSHTPRLLSDLHDAIVTHVGQHRDATLDELRAWLREAHGVSASMGLMWNTLVRLGLTLKKRPSTPLNRRVPISLKRAGAGERHNPGWIPRD
jgi:transposase